MAAGAYSQLAPQMVPVLNKRRNLTAIQINDTIRTATKPIIVHEKIDIAQDLNDYPPNYLGKSMMTPTAWGPDGGGVLFAGLGGTFPAIYTAKPDLLGVIGLAVGDPKKAIGVVGMLNVNNVSEFSTFSGNLILHKRLSESDAVSAGGIHLFASQRSDATESFYVVYSHAVQATLAADADYCKLNYSIGAGTGRFYTKSPADQVLRGKSIHGTAVFANVSYGLARWMNVNAEWSGINLHTSVSLRPAPSLPFVNLGLADLTRNSGDRIRFIVSIHYGIPLWD